MTTVKNYRYINCRSFGHSWKPTEITADTGWGYGIEVECTVCKMHRLDTINSRGEVGKRRYMQPDGYRNPDVPERTKYRKELLRRALKA